MYSLSRVVAACSAALFLGMLAFSCVRAPKPGSHPSAPGAANPAPATAPGATQPAGAVGPGRPAPQGSPAAAPVLAATLRAFGLGASAIVLPEDYTLGPLQDYRTRDPETAGALKAARSFLDDFCRGHLDTELLAPESREALSLLLAPQTDDEQATGGAPGLSGAGNVEAGADAYRLGAADVRGDDASFRIRLTLKSGDSPRDGLLSLRLSEGTWYVEALALEPSKGGQVAAFDPASPPSARSNEWQ